MEKRQIKCESTGEVVRFTLKRHAEWSDGFATLEIEDDESDDLPATIDLSTFNSGKEPPGLFYVDTSDPVPVEMLIPVLTAAGYSVTLGKRRYDTEDLIEGIVEGSQPVTE